MLIERYNEENPVGYETQGTHFIRRENISLLKNIVKLDKEIELNNVLLTT